MVSNDDFVRLIELSVKESSQSEDEIETKMNILDRLFNENFLRRYENFETEVTDEELDLISQIQIPENK